MKENNLLQQLGFKINNAKELKVEYGVTGQEVNRENNDVITFSSNTTMKVNYEKRKGSLVTIRSDFLGTYTTKEVFENYKKEVMEEDTITKSPTEFSVQYSEDDYNKLFNSGGKLYPLQIEELIPIDSQMNNENCQVCVPSDTIISSISGYVKSTYAIYKKDDYYDITRIINQLDEETQIPLMQYCNIKIYIISS